MQRLTSFFRNQGVKFIRSPKELKSSKSVQALIDDVNSFVDFRRDGKHFSPLLIGLFASHFAFTNGFADYSETDYTLALGESHNGRTTSMGVGLNGVTDYSTQQPFIDVFKTARPWLNYDQLSQAGVLDENGWVKRIPDGIDHYGTVLLTNMAEEATSLAGSYRLTYDGQGEIVVHGADTVEYGDGTIWFDYTPRGSNLVGIDITKSDAGDYIRNISVVHANNIESHEAGKTFNPAWISLIEDMSSLRFMDWMGTNNSQQAEWDDRPTLDSFTWDIHASGVPLEVMVKLANQTGADPWFNIPHLASPEYIKEFAIYVRDNLDPKLTAYFEYSNEVWNFQFEQAQWAYRQGSMLWPEQGDAWIQFQASKVSEMAQVLDQVFEGEPEGRLSKVISTQTGWLGLEEPLLEAPNWVADDPDTHDAPHTYVDAYSITGYFSGNLGGEKAPVVKTWLDKSLAQAKAQADELTLKGDEREQYIASTQYDAAVSLAIQELRDGSITGDEKGSLKELFEIFDYHARVAEEYDLELVMYEGGTHVVGTGDWFKDEQLTKFFNHLNYTDEMGVLYKGLIDGWADAGGTLFNAFVDVATPGYWGSWGARRYIEDDTARWDAIVEYAQYNPEQKQVQSGYPLGVRQVHSGHSLTDTYTNAWWKLSNMINSLSARKAKVARSTVPGSEMKARRENEDFNYYGNPNAWKDIADFELLVITERNDIYPEALFTEGWEAEYRLERRDEFSRWVNHAWENGNGGNGAATMLYTVWTAIDVSNPDFRERLDYDGVEWEALAEFANEKRPEGAPPVFIIPGHRVMARLYDDIEKGLVPGVDNIKDFFSDNVHPNHLGGYMISLLHLAAIHQVDLTQVPTRFGGGTNRQPLDQVPSPEIAAYLKEMVQDVLSEYKYSGVPATAKSDEI